MILLLYILKSWRDYDTFQNKTTTTTRTVRYEPKRKGN